MNIVRENLEDGTTLLKATVAEADYNEAVQSVIPMKMGDIKRMV